MSLRKRILLGVASAGVIAFGAMQVAAALERRNEREHAIQSELQKVTSDAYAYHYVWQELVEAHGSQHAALDALHDWAEAMADFRQAESLWRQGRGVKPDYPSPLLLLTDDDADRFKRQERPLPYGTTYANEWGSLFVWW